MVSQELFLKEVEGFLTRSKMTATAFGKGAAGDPSFVFDLRNGRSCTLAVVDRVRGWMRANEPSEQAA